MSYLRPADSERRRELLYEQPQATDGTGTEWDEGHGVARNGSRVERTREVGEWVYVRPLELSPRSVMGEQSAQLSVVVWVDLWAVKHTRMEQSESVLQQHTVGHCAS
jgi:hypothetical protein